MDFRDPRAEGYLYTTVADKEGRFQFTKIPAGEYFVVCVITWKFEAEGHLWQQSVTVHGRVSVGPDEQVEVALHHCDYPRMAGSDACSVTQQPQPSGVPRASEGL